MRTTTDKGVGLVIAAAAKEGFISRDEARKIAWTLEDAAIYMEMESKKASTASLRGEQLMRRADLLMAVSDAIDEALRADGQAARQANTEEDGK